MAAESFVARLAIVIVFLLFTFLNVDIGGASHRLQLREDEDKYFIGARKRMRRSLLQLAGGAFDDPKTVHFRSPPFEPTGAGSPSVGLGVPAAVRGYFNLSCPFEWSKYSCAYMQRGVADAEIVQTSRDYYLQHLDRIQTTFGHVAAASRGTSGEGQPKRVFFSGDSLMRQIFIGIACNAAMSLGSDLIERAVFPWKDEWPCRSGACTIMGGVHGGFDAASIRLSDGTELHFVPHAGYKDDETAEEDVLERMMQEVAEHGRITFGEKTAMPPGGPEVDILIYNVGIHHSLPYARKEIRRFIKHVSEPLMKKDGLLLDSDVPDLLRKDSRRPRIIYVTTPTQHYATRDGQWKAGHMTKKYMRCVEEVSSNPRAVIEKELLLPGVNLDILLDYDDLDLGKMHVKHGHDCSHYCMPGVPDMVATRLMEEILA